MYKSLITTAVRHARFITSKSPRVARLRPALLPPLSTPAQFSVTYCSMLGICLAFPTLLALEYSQHHWTLNANTTCMWVDLLILPPLDLVDSLKLKMYKKCYCISLWFLPPLTLCSLLIELLLDGCGNSTNTLSFSLTLSITFILLCTVLWEILQFNISVN